jgi:hypothetical protein
MRPFFTSLSRSHVTFALCAVAVGLACAAVTADAQVSTINSVVVLPQVLDYASNAVNVIVTNYPETISFAETNVYPQTGGFCNEDLWLFSADGGLTAYNFTSNDTFTATMTVTLDFSTNGETQGAGFAFNNSGGFFNGQYIVDNNHEVVAFGGNLPFYAGPLDHTYQSGETITLGVTLLQDNDGNPAIIYSANGLQSPVLDFGPGQFAGTSGPTYTLGGYFQIFTATNLPNNGSAVFSNIKIGQPLSIATVGGQSVIFWSAAATNYVLQSSTNVSSTNWTTVTSVQPITGVLVPNTAPATFYRLQAQ